MDYACEFAQRVIGVSAGRIVFEGRPEELTEEVLQRIYPGGFEAPNCAVPGAAPADTSATAAIESTPVARRPTPELALEQS